jgi:hypothetical protein
VPSDAVIVRAGARKVAVLNAQHNAHYQVVQFGRDFGATVEMLLDFEAATRSSFIPATTWQRVSRFNRFPARRTKKRVAAVDNRARLKTARPRVHS